MEHRHSRTCWSFSSNFWASLGRHTERQEILWSVKLWRPTTPRPSIVLNVALKSSLSGIVKGLADYLGFNVMSTINGGNTTTINVALSAYLLLSKVL